MDRRDRTFDLGRRLAKRLLPVTVLIGTLIGLGFPAAYYILTLEEWRHEATGLAAELGRHLEPILLENPTLWKYQHPKYQHILENFIIHRNVASVRVLDEGGRPVPGYAYARAAADRWWNARAVVGSAPILFNNRRVGTAQVGLDQRAVLRGTALLFVFSTVVGVGLALVAYFFPVKVVTKQEVQVQDLTETLQQANAELEAKVEERKRAEEALQRNYDTQTVINSLLRFSLEEAPLGDLLHRTLGLILSIPWLAFESQGSIFLVEGEPAVLVMKVQRGLAEAIQKACARVPFGRCLCGRAALAQEIQFADRLDDRHEVTYEGIAPHGHYSAPILYAGRTLGVINVYLQEGHRDDEREREFLAAVANALSGIIERRRAEEALVTRTRQLEAVRAVTAEITRELDLTNLLELILHRVLELVGVANGVLYLWDEAAQVLVPRAWTGQREWLREERLRLGERVVGTVAERRQGMVVNDFRTSPYATPFVLERTTHTAVLAEPLLYRDRLIGVVTMNNEGTGQSFSEQDRETLALFAAQAAIAIENAQLYEAAVRRGEELAALLQASRSVMSGLDLQGILKRIVAEAAQIARTPHIKVVLVDRETQTLRIVAAAGRPTEMLADFRHPLGSGLSGLVATRGEPLFVPNCQDDPRNFGADQDRALGIQTYLGLPIKSRNEVIGVLTFNTTEPREYTPQELDYLTSFADQAAIALENARLYAASEGRATALETLREIGQAITSRLELPAVLEAVVMGAMRLLNNPFAQIILWDEQSQRLRYGAANGPEAERVRNQSFELGRGINGTVAQIRQPMVLDDYQASPYVVPECFDIVATITVPILFGDRLLGVLHSHTTEPGRRFTSDDLRRFQMLAAQAAIAIENARLHEATLRQLTELKALHDMGQAITSSLSLDEQLGLLVERLAQATGAQRVLVGLLEAGGAGGFRLSLAYDASKADPWLRHLHLLPERYPEIQEVLRTGGPLVIPDVFAEPLLAPVREYLEPLHLRSLLVVPLIVRETIIGAVSLGFVGQGRTFTGEEVDLLQSFATQAAIAIEKARLYEELRQAAIQLEAKVEDRTRELQAANLRLQEASRHKSEFLANMSHEIRTPLNAVIGFSELLREQRVGPLNEKQTRYISHVSNGGKHLLQLINDILDLSKVEAGKFILRPEPLPVTQTLEDVLVIGRGLASKKEQEIRTDIDPEIPPLTADPVRFKQILFNLLSNAVKFSPNRGTITLTARKASGHPPSVGTRREEESDPRLTPHPSPLTECLEIRVADTGVGIKPDDLPRLFQEFAQLEATQGQSHEGTGLGLALTKRLVELHGGRIWAESAGPGRGSTFTILLPFGGPGNDPIGPDDSRN